MITFLDDPVEKLRQLGRDSLRKHAAVAYVTQNYLQLSDGDMLVCDCSDRAISSRQTDRELIARLVADDVEVFSCDSLHAKLVVFDHKKLFVGSANLSRYAAKQIECGILTDDVSVVADATKFIYELAEVSEPVTDAFIDRIFALPLQDVQSSRISRQTRSLNRRRRRGDLEVRYWFFKGVKHLSKAAQSVADSLQAHWEAGQQVEPHAEEVDEHDDPLHFAGLESYSSRWKRDLHRGDQVLFCYEDEEWGWIVLPPRTVENSKVRGKSLIAGTVGRYWDGRRSLYLETVLDRLELPNNASLRCIPSSDQKLQALLRDWDELIE